jgi:hypothetical protein
MENKNLKLKLPNLDFGLESSSRPETIAKWIGKAKWI